MTNNKARVNIPKNPLERLHLAKRVYEKHVEMADLSPLTAIQDHPWSKSGRSIEAAIALHTQAEELVRKAEEAYRQRDLLVDQVDESIRASRDLLLAIYSDNPKMLGEWGFEVDDSVKSQKTVATK